MRFPFEMNESEALSTRDAMLVAGTMQPLVVRMNEFISRNWPLPLGVDDEIFTGAGYPAKIVDVDKAADQALCELNNRERIWVDLKSLKRRRL